MEREIIRCLWKEILEFNTIYNINPKPDDFECNYCTGHDIDCEDYTKGSGMVRE